MSAQIRPVAMTVNLQGKTVELQQLGEDALFGRASYGKYAYAVGCERLFGLLDRHGIKSTVFVPGAEAEANPDYVAALARRGHEIAAHGWAMEAMDAPDIDERALIDRTHATLTRIVGVEPARIPRPARQTHRTDTGAPRRARLPLRFQASRMTTSRTASMPTAAPAWSRSRNPKS